MRLHRERLRRSSGSIARVLVAASLLTTTALSPAQRSSHTGTTAGKQAGIVITEFPLPTPSQCYGITAGSDGNLWFTEATANKIGQITPGGAITEFVVPTAFGYPTGITAGRDGAVWFTEDFGDKIGRITSMGKITEFSLAAHSGASFIAAGPDGKLWFTEYISNKIGRITPAGVVTEFPLATGSSPYGIAAGPDGNVWFTEFGGNKIGRITPAGVITEFPLSSAAGTNFTTAGPDGNVWFTENGDKIGRIVPSTGVVTEFPLPGPDDGPIGIAAGSDGALWFTAFNSNKIGRITPAGAVTEFPVPATTSSPVGITAGPDGNVWFVEEFGNHIGRVRLPQTGTANRVQQTAPIKLGTSGSNIQDSTGTCCSAGTLGSLVKDAAGQTYILSNNHVLARLNAASIGETIMQTGYIDTVPQCSTAGAIGVAELNKFVSLSLTGQNTVDAAIADVIPGQVDPSGSILGIGTVSAVTATPALRMRVMKSGRTTGKTTGSIDVLHVTANITAGSCAGPFGPLKFVEQFGVIPYPFDQGGDSGSLIVKQVSSGRPNPVGLLFAKSNDGTTLANPIDTVLTALGVTFVAAAPTAAERANAAPAATDPRVEATAGVKKRYEDFLLGLPEVVGHGVGYSQSGSGKVVIRLFLRKTTDAARRAAPTSLEGIPVELQETGDFQATPICSKATN